MKSSINSKKKHGLKRFILVIGACLAMLMAGSSVNAASCIDLADIPLDALEQAAPGLIMFVLDDSGSMDWSTMTRPGSGESEGTFDGMEYVFHNPGDDVYGTREHIEDFDTHRMMWMSQWSGYNGMYYNPETEYTPWPTLGNADVNNPRSNPMVAANTLDMTATWQDWSTLGVVVDNADATGFTNSPAPATWTSNGGGWNGTYLHTSGGAQTYTASWTATGLDPTTTYDVQARWLNGGIDRETDVVYVISDNGANPQNSAPMNQQANLNTWMTIATGVTFSSGTGVVTLNRASDSSGLCADAVQFIPQSTLISNVARRHYFVQNANGTYLVNLLSGVIEYYQVNLVDPADNREVVTADKLVRLTGTDPAAAGMVTGRTYAEEIQNFANWYSFYRRRELTAKNAIAKSISTMDGVYVGIISIHERIQQPAQPVRVYLDNVLYDDSTILITALYGLNSDSGTPLRNGLRLAGEYFRGNYIKPGTFSSHTSSATYPFFNADKGGSCQQAFTIIFTDGFYNGTDPTIGNVDGDNNTAFDGPPFADGESNTLADMAMYYFENDLNTNLANDVPVTNVDPADHQHMVTFSIAFGVTGSLDTALYANCPLGACPDPWPPVDSDARKIDDMFHAAVNGRGQFIAANNNEELVAALEALGNDIDSRLGSAAALATNSIQRQVGSVIYQGTYNTANWYGDVSALPLDLTTGNVGAPLWQASTSVPAWNVRHILSHDGTAGILFDAGSLTLSQEALLDPDGAGPLTAGDIVDFISGDTSKSVDNSGTFRNRNHPLGDVVHSAPIYFDGMVYIGANDGMLHGLSASTGQELFAYVPNLVYDHLSELADQGYSHKYYVDGTATVAKFSGRNVLVCGLGKGGKGYFALDVTDPAAMDPSDVLWEYTDADLGYTFGRAFIVNTEAAGKVVIFSNGYDSANGSAVLYVRNALTGAHIAKFDTGVTGCNGLATPAAVDVELDGNVDYVYAGDLKGNMWKFDLRGTSTGDWTFGYGDTIDPKPLVTVKNINGDIQPITSPPQVMLDCASDGDVRGLMVIFGTGRYLNTDDFVNTPVNSYYGIWDRGPLIEDTDGVATARGKYLGTFEADRSLTNMPGGITLLEQVFEVAGTEFSALTDRPADWYDPAAGSGTHVGWYWDMPEAGERMIRDPLLRGGHAILISTVPSDSPCASGGTSFINIVNACTGGRPYSHQFDVDKDLKITETDTILDPFGNPIPPSRQQKNKIIFTPLEVGDMLYLPDSEGGHGSMPVVPIRAGMFFWRVIGQ